MSAFRIEAFNLARVIFHCITVYINHLRNYLLPSIYFDIYSPLLYPNKRREYGTFFCKVIKPNNKLKIQQIK